jgi:hypothetical protein
LPQTVFDVGDPITSRLKLGVTPDGTTVVTVAVTKPDGTAQTLSGGPTRVELTDEWTAQWAASMAGDYVATLSVTGTGAGVQAKVFNVRALPTADDGRPTWAPFLSDVADHIPYLTVDVVTPGSATYYMTFNGNTHPADDSAMRHVDQAVVSVAAAVGTVNAALSEQAKLVASLRAAASILRAYPRDPNDPNDRALAQDLDRRADAELGRLIDANTAAGEATVPPSGLLPIYSFPVAVSWGDSYF